MPSNIRYAEEIPVGSVWSYSWGYGQTNVEFYRVVRRTKACAFLRRVGSKDIGPTGPFSCKVIPDFDSEPFGEEVRKVIQHMDGYGPHMTMSFGGLRRFHKGDAALHCSWGH